MLRMLPRLRLQCLQYAMLLGSTVAPGCQSLWMSCLPSPQVAACHACCHMTGKAHGLAQGQVLAMTKLRERSTMAQWSATTLLPC